MIVHNRNFCVLSRHKSPPTLVSLSLTFSTMPVPFTHGRQPVAPALYLYPFNDSFVTKHVALLLQQRVQISCQTSLRTVPGERNGYFDSKVLSNINVLKYGNKTERLFPTCYFSSSGSTRLTLLFRSMSKFQQRVHQR